MGPLKYDHNKQLIILTVIKLSGFHWSLRMAPPSRRSTYLVSEQFKMGIISNCTVKIGSQ